MSESAASEERVGVVVIGRNEGERLQRCLRSLIGQGAGPIVYVDSGSDDGSPEFARSVGVDVVALDMSRPFTMARGRNEGFAHLMAQHADLGFVQFVDGDCEVDPHWIATGLAALHAHPQAAVVTGRRRERYPERSIYNRLTDMEWEGPTGEVDACGGDAMYRTRPLAELEGFDGRLIAGEEPELCVRIRGAGWKVLRIEAEMTRHDAAMTSFRQWWTRTRRAGHAFAEGAAMHGDGPTRLGVRETRSALLHGAVLPAAFLASLALGPVPGAVGGALLALLALRLIVRVRKHRLAMGNSPADALVYAQFCALAKLPEAAGVMTFHGNRLLGQRSGLIEYKEAPPR